MLHFRPWPTTTKKKRKKKKPLELYTGPTPLHIWNIRLGIKEAWYNNPKNNRSESKVFVDSLQKSPSMPCNWSRASLNVIKPGISSCCAEHVRYQVQSSVGFEWKPFFPSLAWNRAYYSVEGLTSLYFCYDGIIEIPTTVSIWVSSGPKCPLDRNRVMVKQVKTSSNIPPNGLSLSI